LKELIDFTLFNYGGYTIKVFAIVKIVIAYFLLKLLLYSLRLVIYRSRKFDIAKKYSLFKLIKYVVHAFAIILLIHLLGFDVKFLLLGSSALLVGLGFGLQNLFSDFISGIIILIDATVKVDDVIEVNGLVGKVVRINFRTTIIITRDDKYIIVPNTDLTKNQLINWTLNNVDSRFEINVGVSYGSDVNLVMKILTEAASSVALVDDKPEPFVRFQDYGDSSIDFTLYFWSFEVFRIESIKSDIRVKIFELFRVHNVEIPFPQRVLHYPKSQKNHD
jgi:small-conductance mechanosensitive channel